MKIQEEIEYRINNDFAYLNVEFEAFPEWANDGIGGYEYWGSREFDKGNDYVSLEWEGDPTFNKEKYTEEEIAIIETWLEKNLDELSDDFCEIYKLENKHAFN